MMTRILWYPPAAVLVAGGLLDAARVPDGALRHQAYAMVSILTAVAVLARLPWLFGPATGRAALLIRVGGFSVVAADVFGGIEAMRGQPHPGSIDPMVSIVWTVMLAIQVLAILGVTAGRTGIARPALAGGATIGLATVTLWTLLCLTQPDVPQSNAPIVLALALAAVAAVQWSWQRGTSHADSATAGLLAATMVALLSGVLIDVGLPHLSRWVTTSAPPIAVASPNAAHRLVDPVGILIVGALLAITLLATVLFAGLARSSTDRPEIRPASAAS